MVPELQCEEAVDDRAHRGVCSRFGKVKAAGRIEGNGFSQQADLLADLPIEILLQVRGGNSTPQISRAPGRFRGSFGSASLELGALAEQTGGPPVIKSDL